MIKITRVQTRPNIDIPFFTPRPEKTKYTWDTFTESQLRIVNTISEDQLVRTSVWAWFDENALETYNSNELVQLVKQEEAAYMEANGVSLVEQIENI
jgi:hypothetical protein